MNSFIKNGAIYSFCVGFNVGLLTNNISINFNKRKFYNIPLPLITGTITSLGFLCSPFIITNYLFNGVYFDKFIDNYDFNIKRYHQYDGNNNKYAFPSLIVIEINYKHSI